MLSLASYSHQLSGIISDLEGKPIPFASIFIKELSTGTTSNIEGQYQLDLPEGEWMLHYRYMGFKTKDVKINMSQNDLEMNIALAPQTYHLKEIKVLANGEDPAYYVMRKAIAMGEYYTKQVSDYTTQVYLKGSGKVTSVPRLFKNKLAKEGITVNKTFVTENISKIHFQLPNKIEEEVLSVRSSGLDDQVNPMQFTTINLYNTREEGFISPLDKAAFSVYKFQFISIFEDQGRTINQIKVIPKRKGKDLFRGTINISETYWNIHSADLKLKLPMTHVHMRQMYAPIDKDVWMPVSLDYNIKFKAMGFAFKGMYVASIKDYKITLNPNVDHNYLKQVDLAQKQETEDINNLENAQESKVLSTKEKKRKNQIKELFAKEDMTNSDMRKLNRLMEKDNATKEKIKQPLEIKIEKVKMAKGAKDRDSIFWDEMRPIPLSKDEQISFVQKDSIVKKKNTPEYKDSVRTANRKFKFDHILFGKTYKYKESNSRLSTPGLLSIDKVSYNTVQGFTLETPFSYTKEDTIGHFFQTKSSLKYAFSRQHLDFSIESRYRYNGMKRAWLGFKAGSEAVDFNSRSGILPLLNTSISLLYKQNNLKLYDKNYISIWHQTDLTNGLNLFTKLEYANRKQLHNNNSYYIAGPRKNEYSSNIPKGIAPALVQNNKALTLTARLEYTPHHRYYISKGVKRMTYFHSQPTFALLYKQGIKNVLNSETDFSFLEASIKQNFEVGFNDYLAYDIKMGSFLSNNQSYFADYRQFGTNKPTFMLGGNMNTFRLLDYYQYATNKEYAEAHIQYTSDRFLLKRLPILNNSMAIQEKVFLNYLTHPGKKNYWEVGYGLTQIFLLLDLEVVWSFDGKQHSNTGFKIKLNF